MHQSSFPQITHTPGTKIPPTILPRRITCPDDTPRTTGTARSHPHSPPAAAIYGPPAALSHLAKQWAPFSRQAAGTFLRPLDVFYGRKERKHLNSVPPLAAGREPVRFSNLASERVARGMAIAFLHSQEPVNRSPERAAVMLTK